MKISMKQSGLVALALFALVTGGFAVQSVRAASVTLKAAVQPASPVEGISAQDKPEVNDLPDTVPDTTEVTDAKDSVTEAQDTAGQRDGETADDTAPEVAK